MFVLIGSLFVACTGADSATAETPTITFLSPTDGEVVTAGDVRFSVIVENFTLVDLTKDNAGEAAGYIGVRVDGSEVLQSGATTFDVPLDTAGEVTVEAELYFDDGDGMEEAFGAPVVAALALTVESP